MYVVAVWLEDDKKYRLRFVVIRVIYGTVVFVNWPFKCRLQYNKRSLKDRLNQSAPPYRKIITVVVAEEGVWPAQIGLQDEVIQ